MFSRRTPADLTPNRLAEALKEARRSARPIIDLTVSNPTQVGLEYPADLLSPIADPTGLVYTPEPLGLLRAREAVAADYARRGVTIDPNRIVLTSSTSETYSLIFKLLCNASDEVLVPRPSYPLFDHLARLDLVTPTPYDLEFNGRWRIDLASVERALTDRTRAVLMVHPNNPTGSFVQRAEFAQLVSLCARRQAAIVVDEVFADYELEAGSRSTRADVLSDGDALVFGLGGLSKSIGLPQIKLGWIVVAGPDRLVREALGRLELVCDTYLSVATPVQAATAALLSRGAEVRDAIKARILRNYRHLAGLDASASTCRVLPADGGWYAVIRVPSLESEEALVLRLLQQHNVLIHPGYFFDFPHESFLVASLLAPEAEFAEGVARVTGYFARACGAGDER